MANEKTEELKIKLVLKVDKALYDRIVAQAKTEKLKGTIEDVLKKCCLAWFKGWDDIFKKMDDPANAADNKPSGLVDLGGNPLGGNGDEQPPTVN